MGKQTVLKCLACEGTFEKEASEPIPAWCPKCGDDDPKFEEVSKEPAEEAGPKPHKHSYRKDGTCACGQVRKVRKPR